MALRLSPRLDSDMAEPIEWKRLAAAHARRYEKEQDESWHAVGLEIARQLLAQVEREDLSQEELVPLLVQAGSLPTESGANSLRSTLHRYYLSLSLPPPNAPPLEPGCLAIEPFGDLCVVAGRTDRPSPRWLAAQSFEPIRTMSGAPWWSAWPLRGGSLALPEPLLFSVGRPSDDQLREFVAHSTAERVEHLARTRVVKTAGRAPDPPSRASPRRHTRSPRPRR